LTLVVRCEHGTYVKEWISGEDGATSPSLSDIAGVPCRCVELDVLEVITDGLPAGGGSVVRDG
jgi:tRNA pseudouridine synthase 10